MPPERTRKSGPSKFDQNWTARWQGGPKLGHDLGEVVRRLADAGTKEARVKAADDLKEYVTKNPYSGRVDLEDEISEEMDELMKPFVEPAKASLEKRVRLPLDVYPLWTCFARAAITLVDLNRPKKFGDAKRAYHIMWTFVRKSTYLFLDYGGQDFDALLALHNFGRRTFNFHPDWSGIEQAMDEQHDELSEEEQEAIEEEKIALCREFVTGMDAPFASAVSMCSKEQKANKKMARVAADREDEFGKTCWALAEAGYGEGENGDGLGFGIFRKARDELYQWGVTGKGSGGDDERGFKEWGL